MIEDGNSPEKSEHDDAATHETQTTTTDYYSLGGDDDRSLVERDQQDDDSLASEVDATISGGREPFDAIGVQLPLYNQSLYEEPSGARVFFDSCANIALWMGDKLCFGPPALRHHFSGSVMPTDLPMDSGVRQWSIQNAGNDIMFGHDDDIGDNIAGTVALLTGLPILYQFFNQFISSIYFSVVNLWNLCAPFRVREIPDDIRSTDEYEVAIRDDRHYLLRYLFGLLTTPLWLPVVVLSNLALGTLESLRTIIGAGFNWLVPKAQTDELDRADGEDPFFDNRHWSVRWAFGILTAPITIPTLIITNLCTSFYYGCAYLFSVGIDFAWEPGVLPEKNANQSPKAQDDEDASLNYTTWGYITHVFACLLSVPVWLPVLIVTNLFAGLISSAAFMIRNGATWITDDIEDEAPLINEDAPSLSLAAKCKIGFFSVFSFPVWFVTLLLSNLGIALWDGTVRMVLDGWSWAIIDSEKPAENQSSVSHSDFILDPFRAPHYINDPERHSSDPASHTHKAMATFKRVVAGILSSPLWLPVLCVTNLIPGMAISIYRNTIDYFMLSCVPEVRDDEVPDDEPAQIPSLSADYRPLSAKITMGILAAPLYLPILIPSNLISGIIYSTIKNVRSWWDWASREAADPIFFKDKRHLAWQIIFSTLSFPFWGVPVLLSNLFFGAAQAIRVSVMRFFNVMGTSGIFGERYGVQSTFHKGELFFKILTLPIWGLICAFTNAVDFTLSVLTKYKSRALALIVAVLSFPITFYVYSGWVKTINALSRPFDSSDVCDETAVTEGHYNNAKSLTLGILGILTLGIIPLFYRIISLIVGKVSEKRFSIKLNNEAFNWTQELFKKALDYIKHGKPFAYMTTKREHLFPNDWLGAVRPFFRLFGFRNDIEAVLKFYHNGYLKFAQQKYEEMQRLSTSQSRSGSVAEVLSAEHLTAAAGPVVRFTEQLPLTEKDAGHGIEASEEQTSSDELSVKLDDGNKVSQSSPDILASLTSASTDGEEYYSAGEAFATETASQAVPGAPLDHSNDHLVQDKPSVPTVLPELDPKTPGFTFKDYMNSPLFTVARQKACNYLSADENQPEIDIVERYLQRSIGAA